jgi:hypothetical protein
LHHLTCVLHSTLKLHILLFSLLPQKPFAFAPDLWKNWSICYYSGYWSSPQGLLCNIHFDPMIKSKNLRPVLFAYSRATLWSVQRWNTSSFPLTLQSVTTGPVFNGWQYVSTLSSSCQLQLSLQTDLFLMICNLCVSSNVNNHSGLITCWDVNLDA